MSWQPIETAPLDGSEIMLLMIDRNTGTHMRETCAWNALTADWSSYLHNWYDECNYEMPEPIAWHPLPAIPTELQKKNPAQR